MINKTKKHSEIIINLIDNKSTLSDALYQLKTLLFDLNDKSIIGWIDSELVGYGKDDVIPSYRCIRTELFGEVQYCSNGYLINRKMPIPVKTNQLNLLIFKMGDSISMVEKWAKEENVASKDVPFDLRLAAYAADMNLGELCQIMNAWRAIPCACFFEIFNSVKSRILEILLRLEDKYGDLDDYTIDFGNGKDKKVLGETIINIIYNDSSITIGNDNKINNSIMGKNNEN